MGHYLISGDIMDKSIELSGMPLFTDSYPTDAMSQTIRRVVDHFKKVPYATAEEIAAKESLGQSEINLIYNVIQSSEDIQKELSKSDNRDYFDTVKNHFGKKQYTVVFFVGLYCPARCHFCPSVEIHDSGYRELFRFKSEVPGRQKLSHKVIQDIFSDIAQMQKAGISVNIKISGGLEPFSDPKTISWILECANSLGIHSTIFTNGMLLKFEKNIDISLMADNVRISLSTANEKSYNDAYFGDHKKNRKVTSLPELIDALNILTVQRNHRNSSTTLGINTVVGHYNFHELETLAHEVSTIGLDYIEIKSDYFEEKDDEWFNKLEQATDGLSAKLTDGKLNNTRISFTGSLGRNNFFNNLPKGECLPDDQAVHKMFINPFGECTPVHYWAYPNGGRQEGGSHFIGAVDQDTRLSRFAFEETNLPALDYRHLNPFELILSLESHRQRRDKAFGINESCNPFIPITTSESVITTSRTISNVVSVL